MRCFSNPLNKGSIPFLFFLMLIGAAFLTPVNAFAVNVAASDGEFNDRVRVTWTEESSAQNYTIFRCTSSDPDSCGEIGKRGNKESLEFSDFNVTPLVVYFYRVTVCSGFGCGGKSEPDSGYRAGVEVDDFGNSCNEATVIGQNSSTVGTLETTGDSDFFRIDNTVAGEFIIGTQGDTDTIGSFRDASCTEMLSAGSGGQGSNFQFSGRLGVGTFFIEVSGESSATGTYQLNSQLIPDDDYGNSCNDALQIDANSQRSGSLEAGGDLDYFHIQLISSGTLALKTSGGIDTFGRLKDANCTTFDDNDNGGDEENFLILRGLSPGDYYLEISGANGGVTGDYQLESEFNAEDDFGNTCESAADFFVNDSQVGVLEVAGDYDYFRMNAPARGTLQLETAGGTDTYGDLLNANCEPVSFDDDTGEARNFLISAEVLPGDYYIAVSGFGGYSVGAYEIISTFVSAPDTGGSCESARSIAVNGSVVDEIEINGDHDFFRLDIGSSGALDLRSIGDMDMVAALRDANCEVIIENDDGGENLNFLFEVNVEPGTYFLEAWAYNESLTGQYTIQSSLVSDDDYGGTCSEATDISEESITDGQINAAGDHDVFRLDLASDLVVYMQTTGSTDTYGVLRNSDCGFMRRNDDGGENFNMRIATFLPAGVYYIDMSGYNETETGPYQLSVTTLNDGQGVDLTANPGMNDAWFNLETPGQGFFITVFPQYGIVFASWFTHESFSPDANVASNLGDPGHRWYTALGQYYGNEVFLDIELTSDGLFNSDKTVTQTTSGSLYIRFDSCSEASIYFNLPDQETSGWIPVQRAVDDNVSTCEELGYYYGEPIIDQQVAKTAVKQPVSPPQNTEGSQQPVVESNHLTELNNGLNDAWFNPSWPGQGFFVTVFPELKGVFVSWFTFDSETPDAQTPYSIGSPGHRWFTAFGFYDGNRADMDNLELTTNGLFNDPAPVTQGSAGTMSIQFDDCYNGRISYHLDQTGESGEIPVVRALEDSGILSLCESWSGVEQATE